MLKYVFKKETRESANNNISHYITMWVILIARRVKLCQFGYFSNTIIMKCYNIISQFYFTLLWKYVLFYYHNIYSLVVSLYVRRERRMTQGLGRRPLLKWFVFHLDPWVVYYYNR